MRRLQAKLMYRDPTVTLMAVESLELHHRQSGPKCHIVGTCQAVAVVVSTADGDYALDVTGQPADLNALREKVADLSFF